MTEEENELRSKLLENKDQILKDFCKEFLIKEFTLYNKNIKKVLDTTLNLDWINFSIFNDKEISKISRFIIDKNIVKISLRFCQITDDQFKILFKPVKQNLIEKICNTYNVNSRLRSVNCLGNKLKNPDIKDALFKFAPHLENLNLDQNNISENIVNQCNKRARKVRFLFECKNFNEQELVNIIYDTILYDKLLTRIKEFAKNYKLDQIIYKKSFFDLKDIDSFERRKIERILKEAMPDAIKFTFDTIKFEKIEYTAAKEKIITNYKSVDPKYGSIPPVMPEIEDDESISSIQSITPKKKS